MKLEEGHIYQFEIRKRVKLDGSPAFWMLRGPDGINYSLEAELYDHYSFNEGAIINCLVDKINCSGKVFLEPEHPVYVAGQQYNFEINRIVTKLDNSFLIEVRDALGKLIVANVGSQSYNQGKDSNVRLKVRLIRKGKPILEDQSLAGNIEFKEREIYQFTVVSKVDGIEPQWVLADDFGIHHVLQPGRYDDYGFEVGKLIQCEVIRIHSDGLLTLEPVSPHYKSGDIVDLIITDRFQLPAGNGEFHDLFKLTLLDGSGEFHLSTRFAAGAKSGLRIQCKVDRIKKGIPYLIPI